MYSSIKNQKIYLTEIIKVKHYSSWGADQLYIKLKTGERIRLNFSILHYDKVKELSNKIQQEISKNSLKI